jgi:hypothetical protein
MTKIYMAGPLFTTAERDFNAALAAQLRAAGHEIWLPQESEQRDATALSIFANVVFRCQGGTCPSVSSGNRLKFRHVRRRKARTRRSD